MNVKTYESIGITDYFERHAASLTNDALNNLKLKILYLFKLAELDRLPPFSLDNIFINRNSLLPTINCFSTPESINIGEEYSRLNTLYTRNKLFSVEPSRKALSETEWKKLRAVFRDWIRENLTPLKCISKIYTIGSTMNTRAHRYTVPFVQFDSVKMSSDFSIFIELAPDHEKDIPQEWREKNPHQSTGAVYYHFGELGDGMISEPAQQFSVVPCYDYLVEGYAFFPSHGNAGRKNDFLRKQHARLIFARPGVAEWLKSAYGVRAINVSRFRAASFNKVYKVLSDGDQYALKVYVRKYMSERRRNKVSYEMTLLNVLRDSDLRLAYPVKNSSGEYISVKDGDQAVLFTYLNGKYIQNPTREQIHTAGELLARLHLAGQNQYIEQQGIFSNKDKLFYWITAWDHYNKNGTVEIALPLDTRYYITKLKKLNTFATHCHGDLSPINFIYSDNGCGLIDFQDAGYGPALIDVANAMVEFSAQQRDFLFDNLGAFREGYEAVRKLSREENESLRDLLIMKILTRQASLLRLHLGGYGYSLKTDRLLGLRRGLEALLRGERDLNTEEF